MDSLREHHETETLTLMAALTRTYGTALSLDSPQACSTGGRAKGSASTAAITGRPGSLSRLSSCHQGRLRAFSPSCPAAHYHFTSKWRGFKAAFRFNPAEPTSLLYRKTSDGYELEGAMYTAPKRMTEGDLDDRIPLSVAQWHAHVNICLPPRREVKTADWTKFGPKGAILTEKDCDQVKGRFVPQLFGWMVHVYPYAASPEKTWAR